VWIRLLPPRWCNRAVN